MDGHGVVDLPGVAAGHGDGDGQAAPPAFAQHELVPGGEAGLWRLAAVSVCISLGALLLSEWLVRRQRGADEDA